MKQQDDRRQHLDGNTGAGAAGARCGGRHQWQRLPSRHSRPHSPVALVLREELLHMVRWDAIRSAAEVFGLLHHIQTLQAQRLAKHADTAFCSAAGGACDNMLATCLIP
jgi:hypothetical protein